MGRRGDGIHVLIHERCRRVNHVIWLLCPTTKKATLFTVHPIGQKFIQTEIVAETATAPCQNGSGDWHQMGKFRRAVGLVILTLAASAAGLLWFAVAAREQAVEATPLEGVLFGVEGLLQQPGAVNESGPRGGASLSFPSCSSRWFST